MQEVVPADDPEDAHRAEQRKPAELPAQDGESGQDGYQQVAVELVGERPQRSVDRVSALPPPVRRVTLQQVTDPELAETTPPVLPQVVERASGTPPQSVDCAVPIEIEQGCDDQAREQETDPQAGPDPQGPTPQEAGHRAAPGGTDDQEPRDREESGHCHVAHVEPLHERTPEVERRRVGQHHDERECEPEGPETVRASAIRLGHRLPRRCSSHRTPQERGGH